MCSSKCLGMVNRTAGDFFRRSDAFDWKGRIAHAAFLKESVLHVLAAVLALLQVGAAARAVRPGPVNQRVAIALAGHGRKHDTGGQVGHCMVGSFDSLSFSSVVPQEPPQESGSLDVFAAMLALFQTGAAGGAVGPGPVDQLVAGALACHGRALNGKRRLRAGLALHLYGVRCSEVLVSASAENAGSGLSKHLENQGRRMVCVAPVSRHDVTTLRPRCRRPPRLPSTSPGYPGEASCSSRRSWWRSP